MNTLLTVPLKGPSKLLQQASDNNTRTFSCWNAALLMWPNSLLFFLTCQNGCCERGLFASKSWMIFRIISTVHLKLLLMIFSNRNSSKAICTFRESSADVTVFSGRQSRSKRTFLLQQDAVKAAGVRQDNSWPWRSRGSTGHVLLISVLWKPVSTEEGSRVICPIQHYSLLFTTPLTICQALYSSLFYAKEKWKILAWIWFYARTAMDVSCRVYMTTSVEGEETEKMTNGSFWRTAAGKCLWALWNNRIS